MLLKDYENPLDAHSDLIFVDRITSPTKTTSSSIDSNNNTGNSEDVLSKQVAKSDSGCVVGSVTFPQSSPDKALFKSASPNSDIPSNKDSQSPSERDKATEKTRLTSLSGIELASEEPDASAKQTLAVFTSGFVFESERSSEAGKAVFSQAVKLGKDSKDSDTLNLAADPDMLKLNDIFKTKLQRKEKNTVATNETPSKLTENDLPTNCYKGN